MTANSSKNYTFKFHKKNPFLNPKNEYISKNTLSEESVKFFFLVTFKMIII